MMCLLVVDINSVCAYYLCIYYIYTKHTLGYSGALYHKRLVFGVLHYTSFCFFCASALYTCCVSYHILQVNSPVNVDVLFCDSCFFNILFPSHM